MGVRGRVGGVAAPPVGVRWISMPPDVGYGEAALGYVSALDGIGVPVTWTQAVPAFPSFDRVEGYDGPMANLVDRAIDCDTAVLHFGATAIPHWLPETDGLRTALYTTWETDRLPARWAELFTAVSEVMVPSSFNAAAAEAAGADVHVVPHCARAVDRAARPPAVLDRLGDRFVFYTIGTWTTRKAMADTVSAFLDAFSAEDDVALVVKTGRTDQAAAHRFVHDPDPGPQTRWTASAATSVAALLAERTRVPELCVLAGRLASTEIDGIHARGDCFVSLTRSEGWGVCISDAVLFGNPVVVTGWGGHVDYLGVDYPLLVDYDLVATIGEPEDDWFHREPGLRWARARHDDAVDRLRWVAAHPAEAAAITAPVAARLAERCAPDAVARQLLDVLARD